MHRSISAACPNCGSSSTKWLELTVRWQTLDDPARQSRLLLCRDCSCRFYEDQAIPDYAAPALLERGRLTFYLQQGAGISLITHPLTRIDRPPGARYLDVGCGFGFALDFAVKARGWVGAGIDPSPFAEVGRRLLGLDITLDYLQENAAPGSYDIVMSAETIEHVASPLAFVRTLRAALKPDGILVLTTPDADRINRKTPPAALVGLLSPGLHLVFQNEASLRTLLHRAGFANVVIGSVGAALIAYASNVEITLASSNGTARDLYRSYLETSALEHANQRDLFFGFAGRAFQEAVNDADWPTAERAWSLLAPACAKHFAFDPDVPTPFAPEILRGSLEALAEHAPICLAGILYARAQHRLACGATRAQTEAQFLAAASAAKNLLRALGELALSDALTDDIGWTAEAEAALCAAEHDPSVCVERLLRLPPAPDQQRAAERRASFLKRGLVELVNRGQYAEARTLASRGQLDHDWPATTQDAAEQDMLFCLGILDLQPGGDTKRARSRFAAVRWSLVSNRARADLLWAALRGELQAIAKLEGAAAAERQRAHVMRDLRGWTGIPEDLRTRDTLSR